MAIEAADVVTEWGAFYRQQGQNMDSLLTLLMQKAETEAYFPLRLTEQTIMEKATVETTRVLQRFQKKWTPIGGVTFKPVKIPLYKLKIDLEDIPDDLEESWLGFLASESLDRKEWPYIRWRLELALAQAEKDMEELEVFNGVAGAITAGTANAAGTNLQGLKKTQNDGVTAGKITPIAVGAVPTDPKLFVAYCEAMVEAIPEILRKEIDFLFMSKTLRNRFKKGMKLLYNMNYDQNNPLVLDNAENITVIGLASHANSGRIWCTPIWNRQRGMKKPGNANIFKVENVDRTVKAYTDYFKGIGYWVLQYVMINDVELPA